MCCDLPDVVRLIDESLEIIYGAPTVPKKERMCEAQIHHLLAYQISIASPRNRTSEDAMEGSSLPDIYVIEPAYRYVELW